MTNIDDLYEEWVEYDVETGDVIGPDQSSWIDIAKDNGITEEDAKMFFNSQSPLAWKERKATETTENEAKSPQECPHCGAFYDNADSFKDHIEQHEREGTNDNSEKDRQNQEYPDGWQDEYKAEMKGEERETPKEKEDRKWFIRKRRMAWKKEDREEKANEMGRVSDSWNNATPEQKKSIIQQLKDSLGSDSIGYGNADDEYDDQSHEFQEMLKMVDFDYLLSNDQMGLNHARDRARWEHLGISALLGEAKANETFYDQALWLAKAKLEQGGLDIVGALPDIIRNTRTSTGRDFDEAELNRAIEDAIVVYKDSLETGMSMWGNVKSSETEPKLDTEEDIDDYIKEGTDPAPYSEEEMPETTKQEIKDKDEAEEIIGALAINDELEGLKDTYGSSANADPTTQPLEDHSGTDDSSDAITEAKDEEEDEEDLSDQPHHKFGTIEEAKDDDEMSDDEWKELQADLDSQDEYDRETKGTSINSQDPYGTLDKEGEDTVEEAFGDCGCKDTNKAKMSWETATENDKQYWLRDMGEDEGYSYYYFEHLPKRVGESLVNKFKVEESEDRGWSKIPALERTNLLRKLGFPPRDAELVANLEYPQLSESLKKDVNYAVIVKKKAEESQKEKPDEQLAFENDLYSNMYDGYLQRRGQRVDSKKNNKF